MNFDLLVQSISDVHRQLQAQALKAVNVGLTLRNWLIGAYISEYELRGEDRAAYGEKLIVELAKSLRAKGIEACDRPRLYGYLQFYRSYPQILGSVTPEFQHLLPGIEFGNGEIVRSLTGQSHDAPPTRTGGKSSSETSEPGAVEKGSPQSEGPVEIVAGPMPHPTAAQKVRSVTGQLQTPGKILIERLSYSHLELLAPLEPSLKRTFYEIECIKGGWSVRELKRQIGSLYFERSGLSRDKEALSRMAHEAAEVQAPALIIRDPFIFDFLGIPAAEVLSESELEEALMRHLQQFLLELGRGFCFEARQKRLLIGGEHFFCDLVFYHRLLKCHVLIELKVDEFRHEHLGQLNTYVAWYRENEMQPGDQPPVGILLCTRHNGELVHYALAGMDRNLFVSRYQTQLPDVKELEAFVKKELKHWEDAQP